ncbi:3-oxoacyl-ACP synthase [Sinomicrobium kalidii]|uniref:3-oxoacyl-ACP synthase n=1 Tax=Sinomicrobium kalidii TaxID=2900738 RepID=UPI001E5AA66E|nr:3-oxoacyl-ACP synthase [Sinomicrobium kalidii]UGU15789.1 3-oxoacyl-ACP synthase [Sinomicrobium kalidii]
MNNNFHIKSFCTIRRGTITLDNTAVYNTDEPDFSTFIKSAYKSLSINYPKFFKMDRLSKLAFMAADILLTREKENMDNPENTAVLFSNRASSLDTDRMHQQTIQNRDDYFPSPAVFVYTLPNICVGEICIKHKLYAENSFFIFDRFDPEHLWGYANSLLIDGKAENALCGWVELDGAHYEAFLYLVSREGNIKHNKTNIATLYNT